MGVNRTFNFVIPRPGMPGRGVAGFLKHHRARVRV